MTSRRKFVQQVAALGALSAARRDRANARARPSRESSESG